MTFYTHLKEKMVALAIVGALVATGSTALNFYWSRSIHNQEKGNLKFFQKIDGPFSHTAIIKDMSDKRVYLARYAPFKDTSYFDFNGDRLVDRIKIWDKFPLEGLPPKEFAREQINRYPTIFAEADRDFMEQLERFGL